MLYNFEIQKIHFRGVGIARIVLVNGENMYLDDAQKLMLFSEWILLIAILVMLILIYLQ